MLILCPQLFFMHFKNQPRFINFLGILLFMFMVFSSSFAQDSSKVAVAISGGSYLGAIRNSTIARPYFYAIQVSNKLRPKLNLWYEVGWGQQYLGFYYDYTKANSGLLSTNRNVYSFIGLNYQVFKEKWGNIFASTGLGISHLQDISYTEFANGSYHVDQYSRINPSVAVRLGYAYNIRQDLSLGLESGLQFLGFEKTYLSQVGLKLQYHFKALK